MKAVVWIKVCSENESHLIEKLTELGYAATHIFRNDTLQVYQVDMLPQDMTVLKISIPNVHIDPTYE